MTGIIEALVPVVLCLALGQALRLSNAFPAAAWTPIERLVYFVLFPVLITRTLATADFGDAPVWQMGVVLASGQAALAAIALLGTFDKGLAGPSFASVFQSCVRWNSYVALAVAGIMFGRTGLALAAVAVGVMIPLANLLSVWGFATWGKSATGARPPLLRSLLTNPLLIACALGMIWHESGVPVPGFATATADILGRATLALGLLAAGAGLDLRLLLSAGVRVFIWSLVRLIAMPAVAFVLCVLLGVEGTARTVALICAATPTATSGYILARQLGGDAPLMAALITGTTVLALVTMPLVLWLAG